MSAQDTSVVIAPHLWRALEVMGRDMAVEPGALVNQAVFAWLRINGYVTPGTVHDAATAGSATGPAASPEVATVAARPAPVDLRARPTAPEPVPPSPAPPRLDVAERLGASPAIPAVSAAPPEPPSSPVVPQDDASAVEAVAARIEEIEADLARLARPRAPFPEAPVDEDDDEDDDEAPAADDAEEDEDGEDEDGEADAAEEDAAEASDTAGGEAQAADEPEGDAAAPDAGASAADAGEDDEARAFESTVLVRSAPVVLYIERDGEPAVRVEAERFVIGRGPTCDLVIDSPQVSREHVSLTRQGARFVIEDLGSSNGTWLNDDPVERREVESGDEFRLGSECLRLVLRGE